MKEIIENDKSFYFIVGLSLINPIILGLVYVFSVIYI